MAHPIAVTTIRFTPLATDFFVFGLRPDFVAATLSVGCRNNSHAHNRYIDCIVIEHKHCNLSGSDTRLTTITNKMVHITISGTDGGDHRCYHHPRRFVHEHTACTHVSGWGCTPPMVGKNRRFPTNARCCARLRTTDGTASDDCNAVGVSVCWLVGVWGVRMAYIKTDLYCTIIMIDMLLT